MEKEQAELVARTIKNKRQYGSGFLSNRKNIKIRLFKRDGRKCSWCGRNMRFRAASIDHIKALSDGGERGGATRLNNLQLLHIKCNTIKANNNIYEKKS